MATSKSRAAEEELHVVSTALATWAISRYKANPEQVKKVTSCLDEAFLLGLAEPQANHYWPADPDGSSWRYLFRRQCFRCVGVYERIPEGHPDGLPNIVNDFIRTKWWPDRNPPRFCKAGSGSGGPIRGSSARLSTANGRPRRDARIGVPYTIPGRGEARRGGSSGRWSRALGGRGPRFAGVPPSP